MQVTLVGDLVTLCAAVAIIGYFEVGQRLRAWMPIFLYACPATGTSLCSKSGTSAHIGIIWVLQARPRCLAGVRNDVCARRHCGIFAHDRRHRFRGRPFW